MQQFLVDSGNSKTIARKINDIPNGVLLYRIRDAINSGHAAVMIGAGFSRNASGGQRLPDWKGLMLGLLRDLQPSEEGFKAALERFGGTSGMLRLAEEYSAVFGRAQLEAKLHQLMPDAGSTVPGELHKMLLSLPWADVFTTNYDTLLERTLEKDRAELTPTIERRYQLVKSADGLPFSRSNGSARIVKLHGTLNQNQPLTVTEEDYRNYPVQYAPFVNMVQQSMLENVFCLIGFSGEDPNFLLWSGWTRDRLGTLAPPIYLITVEPVAEGQRLLLEARNIFPIPIMPLSGSKSAWKALQTLLEFWHGEPPQRPYEWVNNHLAHVDKEANIDYLKRWMDDAEKNRKVYPGWLVAPERNRERVMQRSRSAFAEIAYQKELEQLPIRFRLAFLYALNWIYEVSLVPLSSSQIKKIEHVLETMEIEDAYQPDVSKVGHEFSRSSDDICAYWEHLAVAVIRHARENSDADKLEYWKSKFFKRKHLDTYSDGSHWVRYEEVLFYLETLRRPKALEVLKNWRGIDDAVDPFWQVRVGALYGELGQTSFGRNLAESGLRKIRAAIQVDGESIFLLSREHWAELILRVADAAHGVAKDNARQSPRNIRSSQDSSMDADVSVYLPIEQETTESVTDNKDRIQRHLNANESTDHPEHQLDLLMRGFGYPDNSLLSSKFKFEEPEYFNEESHSVFTEETFNCAVAFVRLTEIVSYVPCFGGVGLSSGALIKCFSILASRAPITSSLRVILRANAANRFVSLKPLSREYVARIPLEVARDNYGKAIFLASDLLSQPTQTLSQEEAEAVEFALDLSSRLLFRLDKCDALDALTKAISWHEVHALQQNWSLQEVYAAFIQRVLHIVDVKDLEEAFPALISLTPEAHLIGPPYHWPTIVKSLPSGKITTSKFNKQWQDAIEKALSEAEAIDRSKESLTTFHFGRLDWLYSQGLLAKTQVDRFSKLIWKSGSENIPRIPGFYDAVTVLWPAPKNSNVNSKFKAWMLGQELPNIVKRVTDAQGKNRRQVTTGRGDEAYLINILLTGNKESSLRWSVKDLVLLIAVIRAWWHLEGRSLTTELSLGDEDAYIRAPLVARLRLISNIAQRMIAPVFRNEAEQNLIGISELFGEMWEASMHFESPAPGFLFAGLSWWPDRADMVLRITADQIALQRKNPFIASLHSAGHWLRGLPEPTAESQYYVSVLLNAVRFRLEGRIGLVVNNIGELLKLGADKHFDTQAIDFVRVLAALFTELQQKEMAQTITKMESCIQIRKDVVFTMEQLVQSFPRLAVSDEWFMVIEHTTKDPLLDIRNLVLV